MKDWIISGKTGTVYAVVDIRQDESINNCYTGEILQYSLSAVLALLIDEYDELVNACVISLLDEVEERIYRCDLKLKISDEAVFCLNVKSGRCSPFLQNIQREMDLWTTFLTLKTWKNRLPVRWRSHQL